MSVNIQSNEEDYWCEICHDLAIVPYMTVPCQHLFCEACIKRVFPGTCPSCRAPMTSLLHDRIKENQMMTYFGETPYVCTLCEKTHPYKLAKECVSNQRFVYYGHPSKVLNFSPASIPGMDKDVFFASNSMGIAAYAGCDLSKEANQIIFYFLFDEDVQPCGVMMIEEEEGAFDALKGKPVYLYKYSESAFQRTDRLPKSAYKYVSTEVVPFVECIEVKDAFVAIQNDHFVFMISFREKFDILAQSLAKKIRKQNERKRKRK